MKTKAEAEGKMTKKWEILVKEENWVKANLVLKIYFQKLPRSCMELDNDTMYNAIN